MIEKLRNLNIENGEIIVLEVLPAKVPEPLFGIELAAIPEHCRVCVKLQPTIESDILVEIWLPIKEWNGKFLGTGNGGYGGRIDKLALINGTSRGYAVANTDMGTSVNPDELIGKPERWVDYGHRATHLMTVVAKEIIETFYGIKPKYSYFMGGSTGGQQGLMEAQRYPEDYNGIVVFDPANNRINLHTSFIWNWKALTENPKANIGIEIAEQIRKRIVERYGRLSGSAPEDLFLSYPDRIEMDMNIFNDSTFLNQEQREALKKIYEGTVNPVTGERIFVPWIPGCEDGNLGLVEMSKKEHFSYEFFYLFRWILGKGFDFTTFDFHHDLDRINQELAPILNANSGDLSAFKANSGKIIMISGTADPIIPYTDNLNYYERVLEAEGGLEHALEYFRYFIIPGMGHVYGGPGLQEIGMLGLPKVPRDSKHDVLSALATWVEEGKAPDMLLPVVFKDGKLSKEVAYDRPVFPYPKVTKYVSGANNQRENFTSEDGCRIKIPGTVNRYL